MSEVTTGSARGHFRAVLAFVKSAEPRRPVSRRALVSDGIIAMALLVAALVAAGSDKYWVLAVIVITCGPLAFRRVFPLSVFFVVLVVVLAGRNFATYVTFIAIILSAYSAVVHSRFRGVALTAMAPAGFLVTADYWRAGSGLPRFGPISISPGPAVHEPAHRLTVVPFAPIHIFPGRLDGLTFEPTYPWRLTGLLVFVSLASIAFVGMAVYAADRIRAMQTEHQAATRRAVELERSRIASELHDVVTHNVSMMIVQAGAARQVLASDPGQAKDAMLAVESSGRAAMTELRHLLGLLSPAPSDRAAAGPGDDLTPQPGLAQIEALVGRVTDTGLPVALETGALPDGLPPGVDLAAFRVVQEALTNVIKHAGKPNTSVKLDYLHGDLIVEVRDGGRLIPAAGPVAPGAGRGLLGLRERVAIYGGELHAGPQPSGGWLVRARIPADPMAAPSDSTLAVAAAAVL
ncbi:MAG TPA: histidine kinase [Streptosporangiaceae bacterium]|nr:histidine kinase [Streptosporangiaceae bacterium]